MAARRFAIFISVPVILTVSCISIALLDPDHFSGIRERVVIGYLIGSIFAHPILAAGWVALGPSRLVWRLPLSLLWIKLVIASLAVNIIRSGHGDGEFLFVVTILMYSQWLILQLPLWGLQTWFGFHLYHADEQQCDDSQPWQFGIRQLMIVTAIIGVILGIGRMLILYLPNRFLNLDGEACLFAGLAFFTILFAFPLLLSALLRRGALAAVPIILLLVALGTSLETSWLHRLAGSSGRPDTNDMLLINTFTCGLTLLVASTVRLCGYSLTRQAPAATSKI